MLTREYDGVADEQDIASLDALSSSLTLTVSLPKRITEVNKKFPLTPLAKREFFRQKQQAQLQADTEARRIKAERRRETARAGIARVMGANTKAS